MRLTTIITDPVHQVMNFGSDPRARTAFRAVVDTRTFQRLRRITQLGLASFVFPGATHTRFSHCVGAAYLAHLALGHLAEVAEEAEGAAIAKYGLTVRMAALLHDVGHGPFSHSFEHVLEDSFSFAPRHEDWTASLIRAAGSDIHAALKVNGLEPEQVASCFAGRQILPTFLKQLVSSQLDVDRMDYLCRDSHFAGVAIGKVDIQYLIHSLTIAGRGKATRTLALAPKGVKAYEGFVVARHLMNRTVYYHPKVKVFEFMMEQFVRDATTRCKEWKTNPALSSSVPAYLLSLAKAMAASPQPPKSQFLEENRHAYCELTEDAVWHLIAKIAELDVEGPARSLATKLLCRQALPHFTVQEDKKEQLSDALANEGFEINHDYGLVTVATTPYKKGGKETVFVVDSQNEPSAVSKRSDLISVLRDRKVEETFMVIIDEKKQQVLEETAREAGALA